MVVDFLFIKVNPGRFISIHFLNLFLYKLLSIFGS